MSQPNVNHATRSTSIHLHPQTDRAIDTLATHDLAAKTLIVFDWDGTLMDSIGLIVESMHVAGEANGFHTTDQAVKILSV